MFDADGHNGTNNININININNNNSPNDRNRIPENPLQSANTADVNLKAMTNRQLFQHAALLTGKIGAMKMPQNKINLLDYLIQKATQESASFPLTMERGHATTQWDVLADDFTAKCAGNQSLLANSDLPATFTGIKLRLCVNAIGNCLRHVELDEFHGTDPFWLTGEDSVEFKLWKISDICKATKKPVVQVNKRVTATTHPPGLNFEAPKEPTMSVAPSHGTNIGSLLSFFQCTGRITMDQMILGVERLHNDFPLIDALLALDESQQVAYIKGLKK